VEQKAPLPDIPTKNGTTITSAKNDDVFVRQESKYTEALLYILKNCVSRQKADKELIFLELDYRNLDGISAHLFLYQQLGYKIGHIFVLCETEDQAHVISDVDIVDVTPVVYDGNFSSESIISLWDDNRYPRPDVIYSDRNYRKFHDPVRDYMQIRRELLSENGAIIIKGFDDGSKLCYPDKDHLLNDIIEMTSSRENVSDRYNGRKLYNRLKLAGFKDFYCQYVVNDTIQMSIDDRYGLYEESFEFRKNYFEIDSEDRKKIEKKLLELRNRFCETSFYYCETNFFIGACKKGAMNDYV
jgi:hypothetical protein